MNVNEFREFGRAAIDFAADYLENARDIPVLPSVLPGYLNDLLPSEIPETPEKWQDIMKDFHKYIMPGITHWQSPNFHAYFTAQTSYPSIIGEILSASLTVAGFSWISSPACTELEVIMMNWLGKLLDLPSEFLNCSEGRGGGIIQSSGSEAVLIALLTAREQTVRRVMKENRLMTAGEVRSKLVSYSSDQSNICVEKASILGVVPMRLLKSNAEGSLRVDDLEKAVVEDIAKGLIPTILIANFGTTGTCAFDNMEAIGPICKKYNIWVHIDAAYAGAALCCPEYRYLMKGIELCDSFNYNLHKWMLVNFDCCAMWFKNADLVVDAFTVNRIYLAHEYQGESKAPDYRHWQIALSRRFRALKVWIVLRSFGAEGIRENIRSYVRLAKRFEDYVKSDDRFELVGKRSLGLVCFRLKEDCKFTLKLLERTMDRKNIYMVKDSSMAKTFIRFVIGGVNCNEKDIDFAWNEIQSQAGEVLAGEKIIDKLEKVIDKSEKSFTKGVVESIEIEKQK